MTTFQEIVLSVAIAMCGLAWSNVIVWGLAAVW
jgi:hypothetical protein